MLQNEKRIKIAKGIAQELSDVDTVNIGVVILTRIQDYLDNKDIILHSENGLLGVGPSPSEKDINMDLMNASKQPVTMANGASLFDSSDSFVMIRGGHIDLAIMGALQIDQFGEIANWAIPGKDIL